MKMAPFIKGWLPLGVGLTLTFGTVYLVGQQLYRQSAYDPQLQRARDATLGTIDGPVVDMAASLAAFQTNVNQDRRILGTTGQLDGVSVLPPAGVFDYARAHSENHLTWQPRAGVRLA
ncbi:MAG TPA: hypothetical protein VI322_04270, partial [Candidatus Saccharimonadia bacterium]